MTHSNSTRIAFIGAGNMAQAIIGGLIANDYPADQLWASDPSRDNLNRVSAAWNINTSFDNSTVITHADIVVLAVKPQIMNTVCTAINEAIQTHQPLVISIAAGITLNALQSWLSNDIAIVRCMPNTPALCQLGATGLFANTNVSSEQQQQTEHIMSSFGIAKWVETESLLDAVTAVSGSGPAYFFRIIELMQQIGVEQGLSPELSRALTLQTALGAARMAMDSDVDVAELRRRVTSPNGTTEAALTQLDAHGIETMFRDALNAANDRSQSLADELT
ncbi:MAG: pyrroline-5-carboxylate reductase [Pseudomonadota bacterium]